MVITNEKHFNFIIVTVINIKTDVLLAEVVLLMLKEACNDDFFIFVNNDTIILHLKNREGAPNLLWLPPTEPPCCTTRKTQLKRGFFPSFCKRNVSQWMELPEIAENNQHIDDFVVVSNLIVSQIKSTSP